MNANLPTPPSFPSSYSPAPHKDSTHPPTTSHLLPPIPPHTTYNAHPTHARLPSDSHSDHDISTSRLLHVMADNPEYGSFASDADELMQQQQQQHHRNHEQDQEGGDDMPTAEQPPHPGSMVIGIEHMLGSTPLSTTPHTSDMHGHEQPFQGSSPPTLACTFLSSLAKAAHPPLLACTFLSSLSKAAPPPLLACTFLSSLAKAAHPPFLARLPPCNRC